MPAGQMDDDFETREDENEPWRGILLPVGLALMVLVNLFTGKVWLPSRRHLFHRGLTAYYFNTEPRLFFGIVLIKIGFAFGLFAWYGMANRLRFDQHIFALQLVAIVIIALGFIFTAAHVGMTISVGL